MIKIFIERILIEYLEPHLILVKSYSEKRYLGISIEEEGYQNPFLCVRILDDQVADLMSGDIDVKTIFVRPYRGIWYLADIKNKAGKMEKFRESLWEVPVNHLPGAGLFVSPDTPAKSIAANISAGTVDIGGRWTPSDFQQVNRSYNQIYSLAFLLENGADDEVCNRVIAHPYRDGFSSMHLHRELLSDIPPWFRPRVKEVQYASPGFIKFIGQTNSIKYFVVVCTIIKNNYSDLFKTYSDIYKYLAEHKLLGLDVSDFKDVHEREHGKQLDRHFKKLCTVLQFEESVISKFQNANKLGKVKYLLVYMRRIDELRQLVFSEKITII